MAEHEQRTGALPTSETKNNPLQRPTSLIVGRSTSPIVSSVPNTSENVKPSSLSKHHQSPTTVIEVPPSPTQNKLTPISPTSQDTSAISNAVPQQTNSFTFMEMASSFFRWGGKSGSSAAANANLNQAAHSDIVSSKAEASPKSTIVDIEGTADQQTKSNKPTSDKPLQGPTVNVITNPNENLKVSSTSQPNVAVVGVGGKQRQSRKTMRAPQPPVVTGAGKGDIKRISQFPTQHSFQTDAAEVQQTEEKLLKLLSDFNSGKLKAFSEDGRQGAGNMMAKMEDIRDQQEALGKLHFEQSGSGIECITDGKKQPAPLSKERLTIANENMDRLMTHLEKLSLAIENLSPPSNPTSASNPVTESVGKTP